jgi:hypothetical protein
MLIIVLLKVEETDLYLVCIHDELHGNHFKSLNINDADFNVSSVLDKDLNLVQKLLGLSEIGLRCI